jgi:secreted Zn-dependent insulinase-like peptidase
MRRLWRFVSNTSNCSKNVLTLFLAYADPLEPAEKFRMIWEELRAMDEAHFRFAEKDQPSSFTSSTAASMQHCYPPDWVLSAPHILREVSESFQYVLMMSLTSMSSNSVLNTSAQIDFDFSLLLRKSPKTCHTRKDGMVLNTVPSH